MTLSVAAKRREVDVHPSAGGAWVSDRTTAPRPRTGPPRRRRHIRLGPPHPWPWLAGDSPQEAGMAFAIEVLHDQDHDAAAKVQLAREFRDRWSTEDLCDALDTAAGIGRLEAPLERLRTRLRLRRLVG